MKKVQLTNKQKLSYYSPIVYSILILLVIELYFYMNGYKTLILIKVPIIYLLILTLSSIDYVIGNSNLKFEKLSISLNEEQLKSVLQILMKSRNWTINESTHNKISGNSYNPKVLRLPVKIDIIKEQSNFLIASYVNPNSTISNTSTFGERKKNINWFKEVSKLIKEEFPIDQIPKRVKQILDKQQFEKSEFSIEILGKRVIVYTIIIGLILVPYIYKESILFYPFLILPVIGLVYIIIDIKTLKMKSSR